MFIILACTKIAFLLPLFVSLGKRQLVFVLIVHLFVSYAYVNLCHFFSSSWCKGLAATSACGSSWIFLFTFFRELSLLWQLKVSIDILWEKWKLAFIAMSLQIFWQTFYRNVPWVVLYNTYHFCVNLLIWLVAMAIEKANLEKQYQTIIYSEAIRWIKLKRCRNIHSISLYKNDVLLPLLIYFRCYGNLTFPLTYNEKSENWHKCCLIADILTKMFWEMFVEGSSTKYILFVQTSQFDWLSWQSKG